MLDIEDLGIYEIFYRFWDYGDTSHPQDVGYLGFKDTSILSTFQENNLETPHSQDVGFWGSKDIWDVCSFGQHLKTPHLQDVGYWGCRDIWNLVYILRLCGYIAPPGCWIFRI